MKILLFEDNLTKEFIEKFENILVNYLSEDIMKFSKKRWEIIWDIYNNNLEESIEKITILQTQYSDSKKIPSWLYTDLLIDKRNIYRDKGYILSTNVQKEINDISYYFHYPLIDNFRNTSYQYFIKSDIKKNSKGLLTFTISSEIISVFESLAKHLMIAMIFGSFSQIFIGFYDHLYKVAYYTSKEKINSLRILNTFKILILKNDSRAFETNFEVLDRQH